MTGTDTIAIARNGANTRLVYTVDFRLKWRFLEPLAVPFSSRLRTGCRTAWPARYKGRQLLLDQRRRAAGRAPHSCSGV